MRRNIEINKNRFNTIIKSKNDNKLDIWYCLKDLVELKGISYRSLKNMVKDVYTKNKDQGTIYKKSGRYFIKYNLLDAFELKQPRRKTIYSHNWKANISYTTKDCYSIEYHQKIIDEIKDETSSVNYLEAIEQDKSNRFHVHMIADYEPKYLKPIISDVLNKYLDSSNNYRLYCEPVQNKACSINYLIKNPQ
tara:strand:- start:996 stop:1571 length:576 start_codon:yes stop_codon:yes gene_type:complete